VLVGVTVGTTALVGVTMLVGVTVLVLVGVTVGMAALAVFGREV